MESLQYVKEKIMLIEQKLELYKSNERVKCPVVTFKLEKELDDLYEQLFIGEIYATGNE